MTKREAVRILMLSPLYLGRPLKERLEMVNYQKHIARAAYVAAYFGVYAVYQTVGG